ncbi:MAG: hypothetical protein ABSC13_03100 [Dehalococcoidia bacterium]|jgi:hypothetical protein
MDEQANREMKFVENFIEFGALHRGRVAWGLREQFTRTPNERANMRASLALDLVQTYLNTYEDIAIWLHVLQKWVRRQGNVTQLLDRERAVGQRHRISHLQRLSVPESGHTGESLARRLGLPYRDRDNWEAVHPSSRDRLRRDIDELARLSNALFSGAQSWTRSGDLGLWRAWNKTKHGLFVTLRRSRAGAGNILTIHVNPDDLGERYELPVQDRQLVRLLVRTFMGCVFLGRALDIVYQLRFQRVPEVSWMAHAAAMNMTEVSREDIEEVLSASHVQRQSWLLGPGPHDPPYELESTFAVKLASGWRIGVTDTDNVD